MNTTLEAYNKAFGDLSAKVIRDEYDAETVQLTITVNTLWNYLTPAQRKECEDAGHAPGNLSPY